MRIAIRCDASHLIGTGHVMRCLVLAEQFRAIYQAEVLFLPRDWQDHLVDFIQSRGFSAYALPVTEEEIALFIIMVISMEIGIFRKYVLKKL